MKTYQNKLSNLSSELLKAFNPDQPRDPQGKWTSGETQPTGRWVNWGRDKKDHFMVDSHFNDHPTPLREDIASKIRDYYQKNPDALRHGQEGYDFNITDKEGKTWVVHSHSPEGWNEVGGDHHTFDPFSEGTKGDIGIFRNYLMGKYGDKYGDVKGFVLTSADGRAETMSLPDNPDPEKLRAFLKLTPKQMNAEGSPPEGEFEQWATAHGVIPGRSSYDDTGKYVEGRSRATSYQGKEIEGWQSDWRRTQQIKFFEKYGLDFKTNMLWKPRGASKSLSRHVFMIKAATASLLKDISEDSMASLADIFGDGIYDLDPEQMSSLWDLLDRTGKVGQWLSFSVEAMDTVDTARLENVDYLVWQTAEDEMVCPYCEPLDGKIVSADEVEDSVPAHVNCRCTLITVEEQYGEPKPVLYYYSIPMDYEEWKAATGGKVPLEPEITWLDPEQYTGLPDAYKLYLPGILKALTSAKDNVPITDKPKASFEGKTGWWITMENGQHVFMGEESLQQRTSNLQDGRTINETNLGGWYMSKVETKFPEKWTGPDGTQDESIAGKSVSLTHNDIVDVNDSIAWAKMRNSALYGSTWDKTNGNDSDVINRLADHYGWDKERANLALEAVQNNPQIWNNSFGHSKAENGTWSYYTMDDQPRRTLEWVPGGFGKYGNTNVLIDDKITSQENLNTVKDAIDTMPKGMRGVPSKYPGVVENLVLTNQDGEQITLPGGKFGVAGHYENWSKSVTIFDFDNHDSKWLGGRGIWHEYSHGIWDETKMKGLGSDPTSRTLMDNFSRATEEEGGVSNYSRDWLSDTRWPRGPLEVTVSNAQTNQYEKWGIYSHPGYNENFAEVSAIIHAGGGPDAFADKDTSGPGMIGFQTGKFSELYPKTYASWYQIMKGYGWKQPRVKKP